MTVDSITCLVVESDSHRASKIEAYLQVFPGVRVTSRSIAEPNEAVEWLSAGSVDLIITKGVFEAFEHFDLIRSYRETVEESLIICLLEDEEKSVILGAPQHAADDYLFYRDLSQERLVETIRNAFERRTMLRELKAIQEANAGTGRGLYRSLLHQLDLAVLLYSRGDGELLFSNTVADTWLGDARSEMSRELFEFGILEADTIEIEIETSVAAVPNAELRSVRVVWRGRDCSLVTLRNISKRKRAEEAYKSSQRRLDLALKSSGLGLWSWNLRKNALHFSERWKAQLGYGGSEFPDTMDAFKDALHPKDRGSAQTALVKALRGELKEIELKYRMKHKLGGYRWILCRAQVYPDESGRLAILLGTHIDITERSESTGMLGLETSFSERIRVRMERLAAEIEVSAARVRSNFRGDSAIAEEILELERLSRSFSGLNEVLQLDAEKSDHIVEAVNLRYELEQVCRAQASLLPSRVSLRAGDGQEVRVHGISRRGIRFALTEAIACIADRVSPDFKSDVRISVGELMSSEGAPRPGVIFRYRGEPVPNPDLHVLSRTPHLEVHSEAGDHACSLLLVFDVEYAFPPDERKGGAMLALLAEDEGVLRLAIQTMLEKLGFEVVIAEDGAEAVDAFSRRKGEFDVALIDLQMPEIDGYGVLASIRASRPDIPVIRMSGDASDERSELVDTQDERSCFLSKPFGISDLKAAVERFSLEVNV